MEQLNKEKVDILFDYTASFNIPFKDVQIEVVDHLASALEENYNEADESSFGKKLFDFTETLPSNFFFNLIEEKKKNLEIQWWNRFLNALKDSFGLPVILLWIVSITSFYFLFKSGNSITIALIGFSYFWILPSLVLYKAHRRIKGEHEAKFLFLKMYAKTTEQIVIFLCLIPLVVIHIVNREIINIPAVVYAVFFAFQTVLFYLVAFSLPQVLTNDIEKKYAHLNIKLA